MSNVARSTYYVSGNIIELTLPLGSDDNYKYANHFGGQPQEHAKETYLEDRPDRVILADARRLLTRAARARGYSAGKSDPIISDALALFEEALPDRPQETVASRGAAKGRPEKGEPSARWKTDRKDGQTAVGFLQEHYGPWLTTDGSGLTRADIRERDLPLYHALVRRSLPDGLTLLTRQELVTKEVEAIQAQERPYPESHAERNRLGSAASRRGTSLRK